MPYSREPVGAVALLPSGTFVPGVRVECASFPLTIPALSNACTTTFALGLPKPCLLAKSTPFSPSEISYVKGAYGYAESSGDHILILTNQEPEQLLQAVDPAVTPDQNDPMMLARRAAHAAHAIVSDFPVGCVLETTDGRFIPGCNVEHPDWTSILCAERNVLSTMVSYGLHPASLYLTCPKDPEGTPCGACRQVIVEQAPGIDIWMDRGGNPAAHTTPEDLLPDHFEGENLQS